MYQHIANPYLVFVTQNPQKSETGGESSTAYSHFTENRETTHENTPEQKAYATDAEQSVAYGYAPPLTRAYQPIWYAPRASSYQQISPHFSVSAFHPRKQKRETGAEHSIAYGYGYAPLAPRGWYKYNPIWYAPRANPHRPIPDAYSAKDADQVSISSTFYMQLLSS